MKTTKKTFSHECQRNVKIYTKQHNGNTVVQNVYAASVNVIIYLLLVIPKRIRRVVMSSEMFILWLP